MSVKVVEIGVAFEVAVGQAAMGGSLAGSVSSRGGVSSAIDLHVAALEQPFVVLLEQDSADQPRDAGLVGKDADDIGALLDLLIETFERIGAVQFGAVLGRESEVGEDVVRAVVHQRGEL
jgi:hypothetical protein